MSFDPTRPADVDLVKKSAELIRENFEGLRKDGIVIAKPPLYGTGKPKASVGENGDRYVDTATGNHYYKTFNGQWEQNLALDDKYETIQSVANVVTEIQALIASTIEGCVKKIKEEYSPRVIGEYKLMSHNELSDGWVRSDGSLYNPQKYPKAFAIYGTKHGGDGVNTFAVPDWRGDAVRINDDGRGVDLGRVLGSEQEDAIQDIKGSLRLRRDAEGVTAQTGALAKSATSSADGTAFSHSSGSTGRSSYIEFDASLVARTADETRMRNRSCCMYVYIGKPGVDA